MKPPGREFVARLAGRAIDVADRPLLRWILCTRRTDEVEQIRAEAERTLLSHCGPAVHLRGLIEFSNRCIANCHYCGIRRGNRALPRYRLPLGDIVAAACRCAEQGYGSVVLQSGERRDTRFVDFVADVVQAIKEATRSSERPAGLGITLCAGEQSPETYARWRAAGAHRYLLRIESASPTLFAALHPAEQSQARRLGCLKTLKELGYHVGSGVMIGLPGQTIDALIDDLLFFREFDIDMIGMGPYLPHAQAVLPGAAPVPAAPARFRLSLRMIAAARLLLRDVNIAATTALKAVRPDGREQGLRFGANVLMPQATPWRVRRMYALYDGKPGLDEPAEPSAAALERSLNAIGRTILRNDWGDSPHYEKRRPAPPIIGTGS